MFALRFAGFNKDADHKKSLVEVLQDPAFPKVRWTFVLKWVQDINNVGDRFVKVLFKPEDEYAEEGTIHVNKIWLKDQCDSSNYHNFSKDVNGYLPKIIFKQQNLEDQQFEKDSSKVDEATGDKTFNVLADDDDDEKFKFFTETKIFAAHKCSYIDIELDRIIIMHGSAETRLR